MEYLLFKIMIWFHIIAAVSVITMVFWAPLMLQMKVWNRTGVWKKHLLSFNKRSLQCLFVLWKCVWHEQRREAQSAPPGIIWSSWKQRWDASFSLCIWSRVHLLGPRSDPVNCTAGWAEKLCKKTAIILKRARILIKNLPTYLACKIEMPECVCLQL